MVSLFFPSLSTGSLVVEMFFASPFSVQRLHRMQNKIKVSSISILIALFIICLDTGLHEFSWAVMPHKGHFLESDVPMAAYLFNSPLHSKSVVMNEYVAYSECMQ